MRSQLFGFVVQSQLIYELLLDCSLQQAVLTMKQHLVDHGAILPSHPATQSKLIHYLNDPLTIGFEAYMNEWEEDIVQSVHGVLTQHSLSHEWLRMEELKRSLSWLWPKFRETTVLGQFAFSTTIEDKILLTVILGWNPGAATEDISLIDNFIPLFIRKLEKLGHHFTTVSFPLGQEEVTSQQVNYGPRLETLDKLQKLVAHRRKNMTSKQVNITLKAACQDINLAMTTAKKYAPLLCNRWYDQTYSGDLH
jgi:hypothetical protein